MRAAFCRVDSRRARGASKEEMLGPEFYTGSLVPEIAEVAAGSFKHKNPPAIDGTGYVVRSLEAALWAFYRSDTFEKGALLAANLGDDADTTAAIFGQLGGPSTAWTQFRQSGWQSWPCVSLSNKWQMIFSRALCA
jgi:hypothetical protein